MIFEYLVFAFLGYVSGSIMYAYLLPLLIKHIDICKVSKDGNPGTANAFMHAGIPIGILSIICELLKGAVPVWIAAHSVDITNLLFALILAAPVLGHAFPVFHKITKGGKAIAVSFGVLIGLFPNLLPALTLAAIYIFFSLVIIVRPHLLRSIVTFLLFFISCLLNKDLPVSLLCGCFIISATVIFKHFWSYHLSRQVETDKAYESADAVK